MTIDLAPIPIVDRNERDWYVAPKADCQFDPLPT
jgi:hypothetical protein